jgi:hypothetical protein
MRERPTRPSKSPWSCLSAAPTCGGRAQSPRLSRGGGARRALDRPARWKERRHETDAPGQPRQDVDEVLARIDARETARAEDPALTNHCARGNAILHESCSADVDEDEACALEGERLVGARRCECWQFVSGVR